MERVDEVTLTYAGDGTEWSLRAQAEARSGADLGELVEHWLEQVGDVDLPALPRVRVHRVGFEHGPAGTSISAGIELPEEFGIDLRRLPLVGAHADADDRIAFTDLGVALVHRPGRGWTKHFTGSLSFGGRQHPLALPLTAAGEPPADPDLLPERRTFGPLTVDSVAVDVLDDRLRVRLNARVGRGRVAIDVLGLQAAVKLEDPTDIAFGVDGLAVSYDIPPVTISGGLLVVSDAQRRRFDGSLAVRAGDYGLSAIGSYADADPPSLFAFLQVLVPLGGPPYFYVNRVSGGFGLHRELNVPPIEELESFPLIAGFDEWAPATPAVSVDNAITRIDPYLGPLGGGHWLAAGLGVASFGIVHTQALLTLAFRGRMEIGVLGRATLEFPPAGPKVVSARMPLRTVVTPSVGEFSARAQLASDSYVLDRDCRLTGGFAVCLWFGPHPNAGDFVATFGGYHPAFQVPPHYPAVPRLGIAWTPRGVPLRVKGTHYFALTPGLVMTGGLLEANWDKGALRARFSVQADFLAGWEPFGYEAKLGVTFALEVNVGRLLKNTVAVNVGADLRLWGPPFSGRAQIDFGVMSFAIEFGSGAPSRPAPLDWHAFRTRLLGDREGLLRVRVRDGLLAELGDGYYAVDAEHFEAATELAVPSCALAVNGAGASARAFDIAPMGLARGELESEHSLVLEQWTGAGWGRCDDFAWTALTGTGAPKALWELQGDLRGALDGHGTVDGLLAGVHVRPAPRERPAGCSVEPGARETDGPAWAWESPPPRRPAPAPAGEDPRTVLAQTIADAAVAARRAAIVADVLGEPAAIDVEALGDRSRLALRAAPGLAAVTDGR